MEPTSLKVLRDSKLNDGTLVRWMTVGNDNLILSVKNKNAQEGSDDEFGEVVLPDTVECAMELLTMAHKMLQRNLQREIGQIKVS